MPWLITKIISTSQDMFECEIKHIGTGKEVRLLLQDNELKLVIQGDPYPGRARVEAAYIEFENSTVKFKIVNSGSPYYETLKQWIDDVNTRINGNHTNFDTKAQFRLRVRV